MTTTEAMDAVLSLSPGDTFVDDGRRSLIESVKLSNDGLHINLRDEDGRVREVGAGPLGAAFANGGCTVERGRGDRFGHRYRVVLED